MLTEWEWKIKKTILLLMFVKPSGQFRLARYLKYSLAVYYYYYHVSQVFTRQITIINKEYGPPPLPRTTTTTTSFWQMLNIKCISHGFPASIFWLKRFQLKSDISSPEVPLKTWSKKFPKKSWEWIILCSQNISVCSVELPVLAR